MPKVRFFVDVAGAWAKQTVAEVSDEVADAWCDGERAERVFDDANPAEDRKVKRIR